MTNPYGYADPLLPHGTNRSKCTSCGRYFSSASSFDVHWTDDGCVDPATILDKHEQPRLVFRDPYWGWPSPPDPGIFANLGEKEHTTDGRADGAQSDP